MNTFISTVTHDNGNITLIERFQSLASGQYWKAKENLELGRDDTWGIPAGIVLLIESIKWVDDKPHTVVLLDHPSRQSYGRGKRTYKFIVDEFLSRFEFEPDAEAIRATEINAIQQRVMAIQSDMMEAQANPARLASIVAEKIGAEPKMLALPNQVDPNSVAGAMAMIATQGSIETLKAHANRQHQVATVTANWIKEKSGEISEAITSMTPYFEEKAAAALARTEDVREQVTKIMRGIETLDLYVGTGVTVEAIAEGKPALDLEPLTLMQRKLYMDEELAVFVDVDERFDFKSKDKFFEALKQHPTLLNQVMPANRSIVMIAVTRRKRDYGEVYINAIFNRENARAFLLVRNGENMHAVYSPVESHVDAHTLFPLRGETDQCFTGYDGSQITFRDLDYTTKLAQHEAMALHYKRFLVLMCGLDHRLSLFGKFYEGPQSLDFISQAFQQAHFRFAEDAENSLLVGDKAPLEPVTDWVRKMNRGLQSGSRVACYWPDLVTKQNAPGAHNSYNVKVRGEFDQCIAYRAAEWLYVDAPLSGSKTSKFAKVQFIPGEADGFLVLDLIDPVLLLRYIHDRNSRPDHLSYIALFKRALMTVEAERVKERDTRSRMTAAIIESGLPVVDTDGVVDRAVANWRAANRGAPLPCFGDGKTPPEWKALLDHVWLAAGMAERQAETVCAHLAGLGMDVLRVSMKGSGKLFAYVAPDTSDINEVGFIHPWVKRIPVIIGPKSVKTGPSTWVMLRDLISETTITEWTKAAGWKAHRDPGIPRDNLLAVIREVVEFPNRARDLFNIQGAALEHLLAEWLVERRRTSKGSVTSPVLLVPIGLIEKRGVIHVVNLNISGREFLAWASPRNGDEFNRAVIDCLTSIYQRPASHVSRIKEVLTSGLHAVGMTSNIGFSLCKGSEIRPGNSVLIAAELGRQGNCEAMNTSLNDALTKYINAIQPDKLLLPFTDVDSLTGIPPEMPTDPYTVNRYTLVRNDGADPSFWYLLISSKDEDPSFSMFNKEFISTGISSIMRDMDKKFRDKESALAFLELEMGGRPGVPVELNGFELYTTDPAYRHAQMPQEIN